MFQNVWNLASSANYLFTPFIQKSLNGGKSQDIIKSFWEKTVKDECFYKVLGPNHQVEEDFDARF